ncbi:MAG: metallopeptidase TldD-related protein, partial [Candidatus Kapaibacterium sp.]
SNSEPLLDIAKAELTRNFNELQNESNPPYYISYNITDIEKININASFGNLISNDSINQRILDIDLRVGDYKFDNTHIIRGSSFNFGGGSGFDFLPLDNNALAIKRKIWYSTDKVYKEAIETYEKAKTNAAVKVEQEDKSADFSKEKPVQSTELVDKLKIGRNKWVGYAKQLSNLFNSDPLIYDGSVSFQLENKTKYFVNTEGSQLKFDESSIRVFVYAKTKATDGMSLPLYESYFAFTPETLPPLGKIEADILKIITLLKELRDAPLIDTYSGPAILSGEASGVFFHEIFGHRVEGHREKDPSSSQTFKKSVGESILPDFIDVIFDPTIKERNGTELSGYYKFDDQGVKSQRVVSVDDGIFKSFLMARSPIEGFDHSNGHGRKQAGYNAVSRQSNLIVSSDNQVDKDELVEQ